MIGPVIAAVKLGAAPLPVMDGMATYGSVWVAFAVPLLSYEPVRALSPVARSTFPSTRVNNASDASGW